MPQDFKIKKGYIVRLNAGGPDMIVANIQGIDVMCQSFESGVISDYTFTHEVLDLVLANELEQKSDESCLTLAGGELVEFKTGGPCMTVSHTEGSKAECKWFENGQLRSHTFSLETLRLVIMKDSGYAPERANLVPGDVVRLKSGGPEMAISLVINRQVVCQWFVRSILHEARFMREALLGPADLQRIREEVHRRNLKAQAEADDYRREEEMKRDHHLGNI